MNHKLFSLIIVLGLILAACSPAAPTVPATPAAPVSVAATATTIPAPLPTGTATPNYPPLDPFFPPSGSINNYTAPEGPRTFVHSNLFDFVDGQADTYFAYNFQQVAVGNYMDSAGRVLHVEIWQFADPADAYGVYTLSRSVVTAGIGTDGSTTPERRIAFWQDRYYVHVSCTEKLPQTDLEAFAKAVASNLPSGGDRPALLQRLPAEGLVANDAVYFHLEITIQNEIYLGGANKFGLGPKTNGLLAHYTLAGQNASLLLIEYPDAQTAAAGLQGLQSAQVDKLVASRSNNNLLGAVVGTVDPAAAKGLLDQALK
jgi:hypothetical protein